MFFQKKNILYLFLVCFVLSFSFYHFLKCFFPLYMVLVFVSSFLVLSFGFFFFAFLSDVLYFCVFFFLRKVKKLKKLTKLNKKKNNKVILEKTLPPSHLTNHNL